MNGGWSRILQDSHRTTENTIVALQYVVPIPTDCMNLPPFLADAIVCVTSTYGIFYSSCRFRAVFTVPRIVDRLLWFRTSCLFDLSQSFCEHLFKWQALCLHFSQYGIPQFTPLLGNSNHDYFEGSIIFGHLHGFLFRAVISKWHSASQQPLQNQVLFIYQ